MFFYAFLCLCITLLSTSIQAIDIKELFFHESNKTMMNPNQNAGIFSTLDAKGSSIILHWERIDGKSAQLTQQIRDASDILVQTYASQELEFAHKHPAAVKDEHFLKSLAPLFESALIDWTIVESQINDIFKAFFTTTDFAQFCKDGETQIVVLAVDRTTGKMLGFIQFISSPDYPAGSVKAGMFGIAPETLDRGLHELLMGSIFKIVPDIQRLFIHVRTTNEMALALYHSWGFAPIAHQQGYWTDLEYIIKDNTRLQTKAEFLN